MNLLVHIFGWNTYNLVPDQVILLLRNIAMKLLPQLPMLLFLCFVVSVCEGSIYATPRFIGGRGGKPTRKAYTDGRTLKKIEAWAGGWQLRGVRFHWSNGHQDTIGKPHGRHSSFTFQTGERLKSLSLWGNGAGTRCGAFRMRTNKNREYFTKMTRWGLKTEYRANVGSGIIVGFLANHAYDVDALCFYLLRPIKRAVLKNVNYPNLKLNHVGLQPWVLESVDYRNAGSIPQTFEFTGSREVTTSWSWSKSSSLELAFTATVEAGIPKVASVKTETTWKVGITASYKRSETITTKKTCGSSITVSPRKHLTITGTIYYGPISTKYTGRMYVTLDNGQHFSYSVSGQYNGVTSTRVMTTAKETNL